MNSAEIPRATYHHGDLRTALVSAAEGLLASGATLSLRAVAKAAGVSHAAPYHHFSNLDALLAAVATRLSWYLGAMLAAIALAWLVVEVGLIRRVTALTRRAAAVSYNVQPGHTGPRLGDLDVSDLRGSDELGILAAGLAGLLQRV